MAVNQNKYKFKIGEKVFAKVRGYAPWPAIIVNYDQSSKLNKYKVIFYGTREEAFVKEIDLCSFLENKSHLGKMKRDIFIQAMKEAEKNLNISQNKENNISSHNTNQSQMENEFDSSFAASSPIILTNVAEKNRRTQKQCTPNAKKNKSVKTKAIEPNFSSKSLNNNSSDEMNVTLSVTGNNDFTTNNKCNLRIVKHTEIGSQLTISDVSKNDPELCKSRIDSSVEMTMVHDLLGPNWLTDSTVRRYYDVINDTLFYSSNFLCVNPSISQAVKLLNDLSYLLDPLAIQKADYLFMPINDCTDCSGGGTHWSLLVFERKSSTFFHFDSISKKNMEDAQVTAHKLYNVLLKSNDTEMNFVECPAPIQNNTYDCGVFMIIMTEYIGNYINLIKGKDCSLNEIQPLKLLTEAQVINKRSQIAYILLNTLITKTTISELFFPYTTNSMVLRSKPCREINIKELNSIGTATEANNILNEWTKVSYNKPNTNKNQVKSHGIVLSNKYHLLSGHVNVEKDIQEKNLLNLPDTDLSKRRVPTITKRTVCQDVKKKCPLNLKGSKDDKQMESIKDNSCLPSVINVYSDSMGRGLSHTLDIIKYKKTDKLKILGLCKPGAPLSEVVSGIQPTFYHIEKSCNVIVAGANDAAQDKIGSVYTALDTCLRQNYNSINLVATVPYRYDIPRWDYFNLKVEETNLYIKEVVSRYETAHVINLNKLRRFHFTQHGFHINQRGKKVLAKMIFNKLNEISNNHINTSSIQMVEADMADILKKSDNETSVAKSTHTKFSTCHSPPHTPPPFADMTSFPPLPDHQPPPSPAHSVNMKISLTTVLNSSPCVTPDNISTAMKDTTNLNTESPSFSTSHISSQFYSNTPISSVPKHDTNIVQSNLNSSVLPSSSMT